MARLVTTGIGEDGVRRVTGGGDVGGMVCRWSCDLVEDTAGDGRALVEAAAKSRREASMGRRRDAMEHMAGLGGLGAGGGGIVVGGKGTELFATIPPGGCGGAAAGLVRASGTSRVDVVISVEVGRRGTRGT